MPTVMAFCMHPSVDFSREELLLVLSPRQHLQFLWWGIPDQLLHQGHTH